MTENTLMPVTFHGDTIYCIEHGGEPYTPVKPIVENLGLSWGKQTEKLQNTPHFNCSLITTVAQDSKNREMLCIPVRKVTAFLYSINPSKVREDLRDKLIQYQEECDEVLWQYWTTGKATKESVVQALPQSYSAALRALADKAEALEAAQEELASTQDMLAEVTEQRNKAQLELSTRNAARTKREITRKAERGAPCKYQVRVFTHPQFGAIRTAIYNGAPHFVVGDLITALESPTKVWTRKKTVVGEGLVPESGVIPFIRGANPPEAAEFCRWLLLEIMPVLQKNTR